MKRFGLVGHPLTHSFSATLFNDKFVKEGCDCKYCNFDIDEISGISQLLLHYPDLVGFNVTIPYKQAIMPYLDRINEEAQEIGAVNTVKIKGNQFFGYNTDAYGFSRLLDLALNGNDNLHALILGSGGASKAVQYVLKKRQIPFSIVSRTKDNGDLTYHDLDGKIISDNLLIVNTTPLGMSPNPDCCPDIPYSSLGSSHILIDLIYNPEATSFLRQGRLQGAMTFNGMTMLRSQAMRAWEIWNDDTL